MRRHCRQVLLGSVVWHAVAVAAVVVVCEPPTGRRPLTLADDSSFFFRTPILVLQWLQAQTAAGKQMLDYRKGL